MFYLPPGGDAEPLVPAVITHVPQLSEGGQLLCDTF